MVLLLAYPLVKHFAWLRPRVTKRLSMRAILSFHVYAGVLGALLGILHTGHKFQSPLGITLVASMLIVVLSGFVGRYYMVHLRVELRDQKAMLDTLRAEYDRIATELAGAPLFRSPFGLPRPGTGQAATPSPGPRMAAGPPQNPPSELVDPLAPHPSS